MLHGLSHRAREAKSWPFEQARGLLERVLRLRLSDAERDLAATLFETRTESIRSLPDIS